LERELGKTIFLVSLFQKKDYEIFLDNEAAFLPVLLKALLSQGPTKCDSLSNNCKHLEVLRCFI
jgi:hypothetical protein